MLVYRRAICAPFPTRSRSARAFVVFRHRAGVVVLPYQQVAPLMEGEPLERGRLRVARPSGRGGDQPEPLVLRHRRDKRQIPEDVRFFAGKADSLELGERAPVPSLRLRPTVDERTHWSRSGSRRARSRRDPRALRTTRAISQAPHARPADRSCEPTCGRDRGTHPPRSAGVRCSRAMEIARSNRIFASSKRLSSSCAKPSATSFVAAEESAADDCWRNAALARWQRGRRDDHSRRQRDRPPSMSAHGNAPV